MLQIARNVGQCGRSCESCRWTKQRSMSRSRKAVDAQSPRPVMKQTVTTNRPPRNPGADAPSIKVVPPRLATSVWEGL